MIQVQQEHGEPMQWGHREFFFIWNPIETLTPPRYINLFASTWALLAAGLVFALPMIYLRVKDHTDIADETMCVLFVSFTTSIETKFLQCTHGRHRESIDDRGDQSESFMKLYFCHNRTHFILSFSTAIFCLP